MFSRHQKNNLNTKSCYGANRKRRKGAAAVEFAMTAPLFFLFLFAGFEFSRANILRNLCDNVALETARLGSLPGSTAEMCIESANESLELLSVRNATITIQPAVIDPATPEITVNLVIPLGANALPMSQFVMGTELRRTVTIRRPIRSQ